MDQLLGLHTWGTDLILAIQSFSNGALDAFFLAITWLGNREAYLVILTLLYWCINRSWGIRLLVQVMLSSWCNEALKSLFDLPRPDPTRVRQLVSESSFGFPSNHAQTGAVIVWGYLAAKVRRGWFTALAILLIFLISLSRLYVGIHFPQDVLGGWFLGLVILLLWLRFEDRLAAWWHSLPAGRQALVAIIGPLALMLLTPADSASRYPNETGATLAGILMGAGLGSILEARTVRFRVDGSPGRRALRYLVGIVLVGALYFGGSALPDLHPWGLDVALRLLRYGLVGLTAIWLAPWLFVKLRLADSDLGVSKIG
jgi:membrane-associated phospholipid phosphatase